MAPHGSKRRIVHALALALFQPVVPGVAWVLQRGRLFDEDGTLREPGAAAFVHAFLAGGLALAVLLGLLLCWPARESPRSLGWRAPGATDVLWGVLGGAAVVALSVIALAITGVHVTDLLHAVRGFSFAQRAFFLLVGVEIAAYEESVFRGFLQPSLVARIGGWGVVVTAVLYAAWHPPHFSIPGFVSRLVQGLAYGLLRERTRSLAAPALAHVAYWATFGLA